MTEPTSAYDPPEGTSPDLTGDADDAGTGGPDLTGALDDLPLEAEIADVVEQRTDVPGDGEDYRGSEAGTTTAAGEELTGTDLDDDGDEA